MSRTGAGPKSTATLDPELEEAAKVVMSQRGLRLTRHRRTILTTISLADHPLSTAEVAEDCGVPLSTAYRNLTQLVDGGVVARVVGGDRTAYHEMAEALTNDHRHHLVCLVCGMVGDFIPSCRLEASIRAEARHLLNTHRLRSVDPHLRRAGPLQPVPLIQLGKLFQLVLRRPISRHTR